MAVLIDEENEAPSVPHGARDPRGCHSAGSTGTHGERESKRESPQTKRQTEAAKKKAAKPPAKRSVFDDQ
jgi:hypothetical protein